MFTACVQGVDHGSTTADGYAGFVLFQALRGIAAPPRPATPGPCGSWQLTDVVHAQPFLLSPPQLLKMLKRFSACSLFASCHHSASTPHLKRVVERWIKRGVLRGDGMLIGAPLRSQVHACAAHPNPEAGAACGTDCEDKVRELLKPSSWCGKPPAICYERSAMSHLS